MKNPGRSIISNQENTPSRKQVVLVVDDNADLLSLSKAILEVDDYEVFTTLSGEEAFLILVEINKPDLILLDMRMEDMSGPEFLLKLEETRPEIFASPDFSPPLRGRSKSVDSECHSGVTLPLDVFKSLGHPQCADLLRAIDLARTL